MFLNTLKPVRRVATHWMSTLTLIVACSLLLTACGDTSQNTLSPRSKHGKSTHLVETVRATYKDIAIIRTLPGTLQAIREVKIINQVPGLLVDLPAYPGDRVKTQQILVRLNDSLPKAEVLKAQATLDQTSLDLRRLKDLAPRKLASESEIAQAQTLRDIAAAELQLKQIQYQHTRIKSPINGVISERLVEPGDVIPLHSHLLTILDTTSLKAEIYLSELLLPLINRGNSVTIRIDALNDQQFTGKIKRIFPAIDKDTRRGTIEVILSPVPENARAGQLCRVRIQTQKKSRLMIPYDAVRYDKQGEYVYSFANNQVKRVNVSLGIQQGALIEVLNGLQDQQEIISQGFFGLKDQMPVKKVEPPSTQASATPAIRAAEPEAQ
ncbi:Probable Co/Zn/Cd efflux system membrane fusion protein [hydrothermal vent metagenome]|uniref:Probable Co/Zn/Cd efflux system membrane fusion protein n=1 Tax=hydrothermal vent metagenome TaxID=652676 RepID=A0A3B0XIF4_9ZZZZ